MRTLLFTLACILTMFNSSCQSFKNNKVPELVKLTFKEKYPEEPIPDFEQDAHGYWEGHYKKDGIKYRADFHTNGTWIETENSIKYKELPKAVRTAIEKQYPYETISELEHVMSKEKGEFYDVEFKRKGKNYDVEYRADGS